MYFKGHEGHNISLKRDGLGYNTRGNHLSLSLMKPSQDLQNSSKYRQSQISQRV